MNNRTFAAEALSAADPARDHDLAKLRPDLEDILRKVQNPPTAANLIQVDAPPDHHRRRSPIRILVAAAVIAAIGAGGILGWPWSNSAHGPTAYGVTKGPDGSVTVLIKRSTGYDPTKMQQQLQAAGVRAIVMAQSPTGQCPLPIPEGIPVDPPVFLDTPYDPAQVTLYIIDPAAVPDGATVLIQVAFAGEAGIAVTGFPLMGLVTKQVPRCVPQSIFGPGDPVPTNLFGSTNQPSPTPTG